MSSAIAASPQRVWRALTVPAECMAWDPNLLAALDSMDNYPTPGGSVRWRYRFGSIPIVMREKILDVEPGRKLHSRVHLGALHFDQTYTLALEQDPTEENGGTKTKLGMKVIASNSAAVVGAVVDRFEVRRLTVDRIDTTLRSITKWCENGS